MSINGQDLTFDNLVAAISSESDEDYGLGNIDDIFPENGVKVKVVGNKSRHSNKDRDNVGFIFNDPQYCVYNFEDR